MERFKPRIKLDDDVTIRTFMIATIEMLEKEYGELWGHGTSIDDMTEEQYDAWEAFMEIRERILDMGNELISKSKKRVGTYKGKRKKIYG
jgi:hypothetical protein